MRKLNVLYAYNYYLLIQVASFPLYFINFCKLLYSTLLNLSRPIHTQMNIIFGQRYHKYYLSTHKHTQQTLELQINVVNIKILL